MRDDELLVGGKSGFGARRTRLRDANDPVRVGPLRCMGLCLGKVTGHGARQLRAAIGLSQILYRQPKNLIFGSTGHLDSAFICEGEEEPNPLRRGTHW